VQQNRVETSGLADASNALALDLYARLRETPGNLVISPASIAIGLAMAWAGARGDTAREIARVLHLGDDPRAVQQDTAGLLRRWHDAPQSDGRLSIANRLFGDRHYDFQPAFLELTRDLYDAELEGLDFRGAPEPSRGRINGWVSERTHGCIADLLAPGSLGGLTRLVLVNAIHFLGRWQYPFARERTRDGIFRTPGGQVEARMMRQRGHHSLGEVSGLQVLEMHYGVGSMAMLVVLPEKSNGLPAVEQSLDTKCLGRWIETLEPHDVQVTIPCFRIDPGPVGLKGMLSDLGMAGAFTTQADFRGVADPANPRDQLYVDEAFHQAVVEVDEEGTEAAATTGGVMLTLSLGQRFLADHPFLFFIRDRQSGMILFMGRVEDPTKG